MNWHWPQWFYAALLFLSFCGHLMKNGQPRTDNYDAGLCLMSAAVTAALLYFGGLLDAGAMMDRDAARIIIVRQEAQRDKVSPAEVLGRHRHAYIIPTRHRVWHRMRHELKMSLPRIARLVKCNHSTIGFAVAKIDGVDKYGVSRK